MGLVMSDKASRRDVSFAFLCGALAEADSHIQAIERLGDKLSVNDVLDCLKASKARSEKSIADLGGDYDQRNSD